MVSLLTTRFSIKKILLAAHAVNVHVFCLCLRTNSDISYSALPYLLYTSDGSVYSAIGAGSVTFKITPEFQHVLWFRRLVTGLSPRRFGFDNRPVRSRDSVVGIATRYLLEGPGIEFRWEARFSIQPGTGSFPGVKRPRRGVDHPPPSKAQVTERVEPYVYSTSGSSLSVLG